MERNINRAYPKMRMLLPSISLFALALIGQVSHSCAGPLKIDYLHSLSDFSGTVPYNSARLYLDQSFGELYALSGGEIRVFNASGMEIYRFGQDSQIGAIFDVAVGATGEIYTLSYDFTDSKAGQSYIIARCNYRGEVKDRIRVSGLPQRYSGFGPHYMFYRDEKFLLVNRMQLLAVEVDRNGEFLKAYDLGELIGVDEKERSDSEIFGFCVDGEGNMYFTIPVHFRVYRVTREGKVSSFGKAGSAPGGFGVVTGIAVDGQGNLFVTDKRRSVVMVFDRRFRFLQEFGGYGFKTKDLVSPDTLCVDWSGRVYVSQMRNRGVSVFQVVPN